MPRKLAMIMRDIRQLIIIILFILKTRPKLIYCDSANIVVAFILNKLFPNTPIVVRVLGFVHFGGQFLIVKGLYIKFINFLLLVIFLQ